MTDTNNLVAIKPYSMKELCKIYGIKTKTMQKWLKSIESELGRRIGQKYSIVQIALIFEKFGTPRKPI